MNKKLWRPIYKSTIDIMRLVNHWMLLMEIIGLVNLIGCTFSACSSIAMSAGNYYNNSQSISTKRYFFNRSGKNYFIPSHAPLAKMLRAVIRKQKSIYCSCSDPA